MAATDPFNLTAAKTRLGISDTTQDVLLQTALDTTRAVLETMLNRLLGPADAQVETLAPGYNGGLQLHRIPVDAVASVTDADGLQLEVCGIDAKAGVLHLRALRRGCTYTVTYSGGTLPADVLWAMWVTFDAVWASMQPNATAITGRVVASETHTVPDVGSHTIRYETSGVAVGAGPGPVPPGIAAAAALWRIVEC